MSADVLAGGRVADVLLVGDLPGLDDVLLAGGRLVADRVLLGPDGAPVAELDAVLLAELPPAELPPLEHPARAIPATSPAVAARRTGWKLRTCMRLLPSSR
ncbi:MAG: hypothetical protein ACR2JQ_06590 [Mycobacteriales bacterium]